MDVLPTRMSVMHTAARPGEHVFFDVAEYVAAPDCKGRVAVDVVGALPIHYELYDGVRWYTVPEAIFRLWLRTYELGRGG